MKITVVNRDVGDGSVAYHWSVGPMSSFCIFHANIEQNVNLPQFGGMNKVKFVETADGYENEMESEKYGKTHMVEKYTDEGVTYVSYIATYNTGILKTIYDLHLSPHHHKIVR